MPKRTIPQSLETLKNPRNLLAMDQSAGTHEKFFASFGLEDQWNPENALRVRQMIAETDNLRMSYGGVIAHTDNLYGEQGEEFRETLKTQGVVVVGKLLGLNSRTGTAPNKDMRALPRDLESLVNIGVDIVKLRTAFWHGMPRRHKNKSINQTVQMQKALQRNGEIVGLLEPEFLHDHPSNNGTLTQNAEFMQFVLGKIGTKMKEQGVDGYPWMLKTSVAAPGKGKKAMQRIGTHTTTQECADATTAVFESLEDVLPKDLEIRLLSGGHEDTNIREIVSHIRNGRNEIAHRVGTSFARTNLRSIYRAAMPNGEFLESAGKAQVQRQGFYNQLALTGNYDPHLEHHEQLQL